MGGESVQQCEYMSATYFYSDKDNQKEKQAHKKYLISGNYEFLMTELDKFGSQGWKMLSHVVINDKDGREFYFRRKVKS